MKRFFSITGTALLFITFIGFGLWMANGFTGNAITPTGIKQSIDIKLKDKPYEVENIEIIDAINYPEEKPKKNYEPIVCMVEPSQEHANLVKSVLIQFYRADVRVFLDEEKPFLEGTEANIELKKCDIVNYSAVMSGYLENKELLNSRIDFLGAFPGIVVASAGNDILKDVKEVQEFAYIKANYPELAHKIVIVSSATVGENGEIEYANYTIGEEIDVVIPSENIYIAANGVEPYRTTGNSASTPAISGIIALYLSENGKIPSEEIKKAVISSERSIKAGKLEIPLIDVTKMLQHKPEMVTSD